MKVGFIGCGNMASALIGGITKSGLCRKDEILAADPLEHIRQTKEESLGIRVVSENAEVFDFADIIFLAVKPQFYREVLDGIRHLAEGKLIISMAAGKTIAYLNEEFGGKARVIRIMPNTPALVGEGMTAVAPGENVTDEDLQAALKLLSCCSHAEVVPENLMDTVTAVSGSSPAFVFLLIEALSDAAVSGGMPRAQSYRFVSQAVLGSAKLVLESGRHPGELKDMVCSPAGTAIEAVRVLEQKGLRSTVIEAALACKAKAEEIGKR